MLYQQQKILSQMSKPLLYNMYLCKKKKKGVGGGGGEAPGFDIYDFTVQYSEACEYCWHVLHWNFYD